jgi:putative hemolysin
MNQILQEVARQKLERAGITLEIDDFDRKQLSKAKGAVFVCNQHLPGLDAWVLVQILSAHFDIVKVLHPYPAPPPKDIQDISLRPREMELAKGKIGLSFAKKVARQVDKGAAVILPIDFSDNPLSHFGKNLLRSAILRQLRKARRPVIPVHLQADHVPGGLLRKAIPGLPFAFTQEPVRVNVRIGTVIAAEDIGQFRKNRLWARFLQAKVFSLGSPFDVHAEQFTGAEKAPAQAPLAEPIDQGLLVSEMEQLREKYLITSRGQFDVFIAPFQALRHVMFEIARLREYTFRTVGEGTGKPRDMDEHDMYYLQLLIWDREQQRIVGGYRLGQGDLIFKRFGVNGFYTSTLFKIQQGFYPVLQQAVELGRSYVVPEYQKHRLPLFLLWKGILQFLLANPQYRYLYGPVSISKDYTDASKAVIVEFVKKFFFDHDMAEWVRPRKPYHPRIKSVDPELLASMLQGEFEALETFIETIEPAHFKVPVLFRQYLKQNARFVAFNVDPNFSDCLDGLMMLDIQYLPESTIENLK